MKLFFAFLVLVHGRRDDHGSPNPNKYKGRGRHKFLFCWFVYGNEWNYPGPAVRVKNKFGPSGPPFFSAGLFCAYPSTKALTHQKTKLTVTLILWSPRLEQSLFALIIIHCQALTLFCLAIQNQVWRSSDEFQKRHKCND